MTFRQFAFNNVLRNKRLYAAYFLSSMFMVMVFFTFAIFAFHPAVSEGNLNGNVTYALKISEGIIYVFSFFFVLYSMSAFLQSRKKEFGLMMMLGMSARQIRLLVFFENILIGFFATLGGIALGFVFAKAILLIAENVLVIGDELRFYFPLKAVLFTLVSFTILFLVISFTVSIVLRSGKLINLIKGNKKSKGEPKSSIWLTMIAIVLLGTGYFLALVSKGNMVAYVMLPVIIVVTIGTYLLFTQLSVYLIGNLKKRDTIFWRKTNMILFSDLSFRMKDNARTFFMVAIISTVAFSAIGSIFGFKTIINANMKSFPYSIIYNSAFYDSKYTDTAREQKEVALIEDTLGKSQIQTKKAQALVSYFSVSNQKQSVVIIKQSDYNRFANLIGAKSIQLQEGQTAVVHTDVKGFGQKDQKNQLTDQPLVLQSGITIQADVKVISNVFDIGNNYYVVRDDAYDKLPAFVEHRNFYAWEAGHKQQQALIKAGETLSGKATLGMFIDYQTYLINKIYGLVLFIGLFIGSIFFVSAGSFLYFRLYTDLDEDKQKFKAISKIGLSEQELKKVLSRQIAILFFAPIAVALIHGAVALTALSHLFSYDLFTQSAIVLSVFFGIQLLYFLLVRFYYIRQIRTSI